MKRIVCLLFVLALIMSCGIAAADSFTDLFSPYTHMDATLDRTTNDCVVKPKTSAFKAYATDDMVLLPYMAKNGDVLFISVIMQGDSSLKKPRNVMIVTDNFKYRLDITSEMKKSQMSTMNIDGTKYNTFILPREANEMCADIAASSSVTVRFSKDSSYLDKHEFVMNKEVQACFGAVYEAYMKYDAILNNDVMDMVMDATAKQYALYKKEANTSSMWD